MYRLRWQTASRPLARLDASTTLDELPEEQADLVRWLVAAHHGYGRPFWPDVSGAPAPETGLAELQDRLQARFGPWRLALNEAVLRLADRAVSREEAEGRYADAPPLRKEASSSRPTSGMRTSEAGDHAPFAPALEPLNLRDYLAALELTRLVSECSAGTTCWRREHGWYRLRLQHVPADLPARCAA